MNKTKEIHWIGGGSKVRFHPIPTGGPTKRALDGWNASRAAFSGFFYTEQNPVLEVLSTPAHPQVTQAVGPLH